jgi:hypothetical protein
MQAIFQPVLHNEKWWYVIPMAPRTKLIFHSLLPEVGWPVDQGTSVDVPIDTYMSSDQPDRTLNLQVVFTLSMAGRAILVIC